MKGQFVEIAVGGMVLTITTLIAFVLPLLLLKIELVANVDFITNYDNAQLTLLSFLSSTSDGKTVSQIISEHVAFNSYPNINQILTDKLNKYYSCYTISSDDTVLAQSQNCNASKYIATTQIPIPYDKGKDFVEIKLVIQ